MAEDMASKINLSDTFMATNECLVASLKQLRVDMDAFEGALCWRERMKLGHM